MNRRRVRKACATKNRFAPSPPRYNRAVGSTEGTSERQRAEADLAAVVALLEKLPSDRLLERLGLEARRDKLRAELAEPGSGGDVSLHQVRAELQRMIELEVIRLEFESRRADATERAWRSSLAAIALAMTLQIGIAFMLSLRYSTTPALLEWIALGAIGLNAAFLFWLFMRFRYEKIEPPKR
jgi:hypothetical protein